MWRIYHFSSPTHPFSHHGAPGSCPTRDGYADTYRQRVSDGTRSTHVLGALVPAIVPSLRTCPFPPLHPQGMTRIVLEHWAGPGRQAGGLSIALNFQDLRSRNNRGAGRTQPDKLGGAARWSCLCRRLPGRLPVQVPAESPRYSKGLVKRLVPWEPELPALWRGDAATNQFDLEGQDAQGPAAWLALKSWLFAERNGALFQPPATGDFLFLLRTFRQ